MTARELTPLCMVPTAFNADGTLDEDSFRAHLRRLVSARTGLFLPGGGAGEAHVLTRQELRRLYEIGVQEGKGKVSVYAGLREPRSASAMYEIAQEAVEAGVDAIQIYQLDNGHGMVPTQREQEAYWHELLTALPHPTAISVHYDAKFKPTTPFLKELIDKYEHVIAVNLVGSQTAYFIELRDALPRHIKLYCGAPEFLQYATLGADGYINPANNAIPFLGRAIVDAYVASDIPTLASYNAAIQRFLRVASKWAPSTARWVKMAMKINGTSNGVLRRPYLMPPAEELETMRSQLRALRIDELEAEAKAYVQDMA